MVAVPNKSSVNCLKVSSYLNLYGLTPYEFRLCAHIARRSQKHECTSRLEKMAIVCKMGARTAQNALNELVKNGMVKRQGRFNASSVLRVIHDVENWRDSRESWDNQEDLSHKLIEERKRALKEERHDQKASFAVLNKNKKVIFVHGYLDLYGLDPYAFRVLAHISCYKYFQQKVEMIAAICQMSPRKVQTTLKQLLNLNLISKEEIKGQANSYEIMPITEWQEPIQDWSNQRTVARLKKLDESIPFGGTDLLESYQNGLEQYTQELAKEFADVVSSMEKEEKIQSAIGIEQDIIF